ncbi:MAG: Tfp pilus assembly protein FimT/FimU [Candidatus Dojkabacteria bacterium]
MKSKKRFLHAYTLIEVLVTTALLVSLVGISIPIYQNFQIVNELDSSVNLTVRVLRSAQIQSQSVKLDSNYGVFFSAGKVTIYKGATFATRDTTEDQAYDIPANVTITGLNDFIYSKAFGDPSTTGTITFTNFTTVKTIVINSKGALTY